MGRLQDKIAERDKRDREAQSFTLSKPDKKVRSKEELLKLLMLVGVLLFVVSIFVTLWHQNSYKIAYRQNISSLVAKLNRLDNLAQNRRLKLEEHYASLSDDPDWFDSTLTITREQGSYTPRLPGLSDAPLIKSHNEKVWERNQQLRDSMNALREEQGAPSTLNQDLQRIDNVLEDAEEEVKDLRKKYPDEFRTSDSPLNQLQEAVAAHRTARESMTRLDDDPSAERDRVMLFNWRRALRLRLEAEALREKKQD